MRSPRVGVARRRRSRSSCTRPVPLLLRLQRVSSPPQSEIVVQCAEIVTLSSSGTGALLVEKSAYRSVVRTRPCREDSPVRAAAITSRQTARRTRVERVASSRRTRPRRRDRAHNRPPRQPVPRPSQGEPNFFGMWIGLVPGRCGRRERRAFEGVGRPVRGPHGAVRQSSRRLRAGQRSHGADPFEIAGGGRCESRSITSTPTARAAPRSPPSPRAQRDARRLLAVSSVGRKFGSCELTTTSCRARLKTPVVSTVCMRLRRVSRIPPRGGESRDGTIDRDEWPGRKCVKSCSSSSCRQCGGITLPCQVALDYRFSASKPVLR